MKIFRKEKSALFFFKPTMQNLAPKEKVSLSYLMKKKKKKKNNANLITLMMSHFTKYSVNAGKNTFYYFPI